MSCLMRETENNLKREKVGKLVFKDKCFSVFDGVNTIGRNKQACVNIKELSVSHNHAIIVVINKVHYISDLNSSNGTFVDSCEAIPFKLYELKCNTKVILGNNEGTYIIQEDQDHSDIQYNSFDGTMELTQTFYDSSTQKIETSDRFNVTNIHDAPTQKISLEEFKIPKSIAGSSHCKKNLELDDIHEVPTQKILVHHSKRDKNRINSQEGVEKQTTDMCGSLKKISSNFDNTSIEDSSVKPLVKPHSVDDKSQESCFNSFNINPTNDECPPIFEHDENYVEIHQIPTVCKDKDIHEIKTEIMDITNFYKNLDQPKDQDDESTDFEDNTDETVLDSKQNLVCKSPKLNNEEDGVTNSSEKTPSKNLTSMKKDNFACNESSNDSIDFCNLDKSPRKETNAINCEKKGQTERSGSVNSKKELEKTCNSSKSKKCLKTKNFNSSESDSNSDDEIIVKRKKKTSMVIFSQDIPDGSNKAIVDLQSLKVKTKSTKKEENTDNYVINETDSETEVESKFNEVFEESIPATQNQSTAEFDTDCIPPTQVSQLFTNQPEARTSNLLSQTTANLSEESFKLGLTEMMVESSQPSNKSSQPSCSPHDIREQVTLVSSKPLINANLSSNLIATEKLCENIEECTTEITKDECHLAAFQNNHDVEKDINQDKNKLNDNTQLYLLPTQKIDYNEVDIPKDNTNKQSLDSDQKLNDDTNKNKLNNSTQLYLLPTQKVICDEKEFVKDCTDKQLLDSDIYLASTQKLLDIPKDNTNEQLLDSDQKLNEDTNKNKLNISTQIYLLPTQKVICDEKEFAKDCTNKQLLDSDIYLASTQRLSTFNESNTEQFKDESMDNLYLQETQTADFQADVNEDFKAVTEIPKRPSNPLAALLDEPQSDSLKPSLEPEHSYEENQKLNVNKGRSTKKKNLEHKKNAVSDASQQPYYEEGKAKITSYHNIDVVEEKLTNFNKEFKVESKTPKKATDPLSIVLNPLNFKDSYNLEKNLNTGKNEGTKNNNIANRKSTVVHISSEHLYNEDKKTIVTKQPDTSVEPYINQKDIDIDIQKKNILSTCDDQNISLKIDTNVRKTRRQREQKSLLNSSNVNSVSYVEAKITKTRKTLPSSVDNLQLKVTNNRKSMTISELNKSAEILERKQIKKCVVGRQTARNLRSKSSLESKGDTVKEVKSIKKTESHPASTFSKCTRGKKNQKSENEEASGTKCQSITVEQKKTLESKGNRSKRKMDPEVSTRVSTDTTSSVEANSSPSKKQRLDVTSGPPERELRKQRPKVVFTMMENPQMESLIRQMGGSIVQSVDACTVLITQSVKRSQKLLSAVALGKPICSPTWITESKKANEFLDPWEYILCDVDAEHKWNFSLKESLIRSKAHKLLLEYHFQIQVSTATDVLKGAIESSGGKCISKLSSKLPKNTFVISAPELQKKYRKIIEQYPHVKVIEAEAIFDGVLRQEIRFDQHYLS